MKPKIIYLPCGDEKRVTLSKVELDALIEQAYNEGWTDGYSAGKIRETIIYDPINPVKWVYKDSTTTPLDPPWIATCQTEANTI